MITRAFPLLLAILIMLAHESYAAGHGLTSLEPLLGKWKGVGEGRWGTSAVERHYTRILEDRFILNRGRSVYPRQEKNKTGEIHLSLDIFSFDQSRNTLVLRQFDNESFATTYYVDPSSSTAEKLVFVAEHLENLPENWRARLTFIIIDTNEYHEQFELDTNTGEFRIYLINRLLKVQ